MFAPVPSAFRRSQIGEAMNRQGPPAGIVMDPDGLTVEQRRGNACVACQRRWPRPRHPIGALPDATPVYACDDCAPALHRALRETAALAADRAEPDERTEPAPATEPAGPEPPAAPSERLGPRADATGDAHDAGCLPPARGAHRTRLRRPSRR